MREKTFAALVGLLALVSTSIGLSATAGAAGGPALLAAPAKIQEGTITQNITAGANWTVTNNTSELLLPGPYTLTGDVVSSDGIASGWFVDTAGSSCVLEGNPVQGVTRSLSPNETCTFFLRFTPGTLASGDYKAKITANFGSRKASAPAFVTLIRI